MLEKVKDLIQVKFNLTKNYNLTLETIELEFKYSDIGYNMRNKNKFSFKTAINDGNEELNSIFSSNPKEFNNEA